MNCLLLVHPPGEGAWNMAVDEVLLEEAAASGQAALRLYGWSPATLSLGYFQPLEQRASHAESGECPVVRRLSGGGAIVHDRELTYSLCLPAAAGAAPEPDSLYREVHEALVEVLASFGVAATVREGACDARYPEPFLCFQRAACGDVLCQGQKIAGSAQRRRRQGILQHGSVLLAASPAAPELPGIRELAGVRIRPEALAERWPETLGPRLEMTFRPGELNARQASTARELGERKFRSRGWLARR